MDGVELVGADVSLHAQFGDMIVWAAAYALNCAITLHRAEENRIESPVPGLARKSRRMHSAAAAEYAPQGTPGWQQ